MERDNTELEAITTYIKSNTIPCYKYNYSLDLMARNFCCYQAYITLSEDNQELIIVNKKPRSYQPELNEIHTAD